MNKIYKLKLHEELELNESSYVMRVSGGWLYKFYTRKDDEDNEYFELVTTTFVPFNNEFQ